MCGRGGIGSKRLLSVHTTLQHEVFGGEHPHFLPIYTQIYSSVDKLIHFCQRYEKVYFSHLYSECFERYKATPLSTTSPQHLRNAKQSKFTVKQQIRHTSNNCSENQCSYSMSESRIHQILCSSMLLGGVLASSSANLSAAALSYGSPLRSRATQLACNRILSSANTAGRVSVSYSCLPKETK